MRVIHLTSLRGHGVAIAAREAVAIVHEVCRIGHTQAQAGQLFPPPTLADLSLSRDGALFIAPLDHRVFAGDGADSFRHLIDELLPAAMCESDPRALTAPVAVVPDELGPIREPANDDQLVLRALYARALASGVRTREYEESVASQSTTAAAELSLFNADAPLTVEFVEPLAGTLDTVFPSESETVSVLPNESAEAPVLPHASADPAPVDADAFAWSDNGIASLDNGIGIASSENGIASSDEGDASSDDEQAGAEHVLFEPPPQLGRARGWERPAALWGLAVNAALAIAILWPATSGPLLEGLRSQLQSVAIRADYSPASPAVAGNGPAPAGQARDDRSTASAALPADATWSEPARPQPAMWDGTTAPSPAPAMAYRPAVAIPGVADTGEALISPDGRYLALVGDRNGERGVFVVPRDGGDATLVSGEGRASAPAWSPDMRRLAFVRAEPDRPNVWNLWVRDLASGELSRLTSHESGMVRGASWFPGGRRLCYSHGAQLRILDLDSGRASFVDSPLKPRPMRTPRVSPDGRRVAFEIENDGIWLLDLASGSMQRVVEDPSPGEVAWGAGGRRLIYYSMRTRQWRAWEAAPRS